jgi:Ca2+:H+ antiporter
MNDSSDDEPALLHRILSWFNKAKNDRNPTPTLNPPSQGEHDVADSTISAVPSSQLDRERARQQSLVSTLADDGSTTLPAPDAGVSEKREEEGPSSPMTSKDKAPLRKRFFNDCKRIIFCSWINWLLFFVPVGIIVGAVERAQGESSAISPTVVFSMNAIAIIPLASLLAFATESVATKMGDTIGALLNVTFGNAVELIVFIIALVANEIQIVQAAALGSILSNLLLILGMCFLFGGLRFREQVSDNSASSGCIQFSADGSAALQPCSFSDERLSAQFECCQLASTGK